MTTGLVFDLKRFAVHDGEGIRSTLFLKGCPLHCPWCQNPEGLRGERELWYNPAVCLRCGSCARVCQKGALALKDRVGISKERCDCCGECVDKCPAAALSIAGEVWTSARAAQALLRDRPFFEEAGGVTLSGGEVLSQWQFASEVLRLCKQAGVDTAVESCMLASRQAVEAMLPATDHFLIDIKLMDPGLHERWLGAGNRQILENIEFLVERKADVLIRTPLIPGYTATDENIGAIASYLHSLDPLIPYELLNFNPLCRSKYSAMGQEYPVEGGALAPSEMEHFYQIAAKEGAENLIRE